MKGRVYAPFRLNMNLNLILKKLILKPLNLKPYKIKAADPEKEVVGLGAGLAGGYVRPWYRRVFVGNLFQIFLSTANHQSDKSWGAN
jgi:hypothetical protein